MAEEQDILLELPEALPEPPTLPPPHTLLIPQCTEEAVATFRFVCDSRLSECIDVISVKFYLGQADQAPHEAPNFATIGFNGTGDAAAFEDARHTGAYEHNITRSEVQGFLNATELTPGQDYVFWSVWTLRNGSVPELNTLNFDLSRTQYW